MLILIHSSKTMLNNGSNKSSLSKPVLINQAIELNAYLRNLSLDQIAQKMKVSKILSEKIYTQINEWTTKPEKQSAAAESFKGDIYSGLQFGSYNKKDIIYANQKLRIISGLYGILKPLDGIFPYRLEMAYKLAPPSFKSLYDYWGNNLAQELNPDETILNLTSVEYGKSVIPYIEKNLIFSPIFLTLNKDSGKFVSVAVHSKIARGSLATWAIKNQISSPDKLKNYNLLGYQFDPTLSSQYSPVFKATDFTGLGLSIRKKSSSNN